MLRGSANKKCKYEFERLLKNLDRKDTIIHIHTWTKAISSIILPIIHKNKFKAILTVHDYFTKCPNGGLFNYKKGCICYAKPVGVECIFSNCDSRNYIIKLYRII